MNCLLGLGLCRRLPTVLCVLGSIAGLTAGASGCSTEPPAIAGTWNLTYTLATGSYTCSVDGSLDVEEDGASLTGTLVQEEATCTEAGGPVEVVLQSYTIVGSLDGDTIEFRTERARDDGECAYAVFAGAASASKMSGSVETRITFCQGTPVPLQGTWQAERA